jgi:hypothetical protein
VTLSYFQDQLEALYGVRAPRVGSFVIGPGAAEAAGGAPEALLVTEVEGEVALGLWLDGEVREALGRAGPDRQPRLLGRARLAGLACAAEGVSHFLYVATRAAADRPLSLLELEVQAEVDKFALWVLHLWRRGRRRFSAALRRRLFERVRYRRQLGVEERDRYRTANRIAAGYARWLEARFVAPGDAEGFVRELRRTYRRGAGEKLCYLEARPSAGS